MEHGNEKRGIKNLRGKDQESFMIEELQLPLLGFQIF
jgi:hypothetical protein